MMAQRKYYTELRWIGVGPMMTQRIYYTELRWISVGPTMAQRNDILNYVGPTLDQHWLNVGKWLAPTVGPP